MVNQQDPFASFVQEALAHARKSKSKPARKRAKTPSRPSPAIRGFQAPDGTSASLGTSPWQAEAIVLWHETIRCSCCGSEYDSPRGLFFRQERLLPGARLDAHESPVTLAQARTTWANLPRRFRRTERLTPACERCLSTEDSLAAEAARPFQLPLPLKGA